MLDRALLVMGDVVDTSGLESVITETLEDFTVHNLLSTVGSVVVSVVLIRLLMTMVDRGLSRSRMDTPTKKLVRGVIRGILISIAVIVALGCLGIPVTSLVALLSVVGLALSLALQNFLANVAGGLQIFASHPFKPGDWVEIDSCIGEVIEIGLFYTKLHNIENKLIQMPNSLVMSGNIINFTCEELRRVDLKVCASYDSDPDLVRQVLTEMLTNHPLTLDDPPPFVHVFAYQESHIQYVARVWCRNEHFWDIYFDLLDQLKPTFDRAGVRIGYPHINVHMANR